LTPVDDLSRLRAVLADRFDIQRELGRGGMATVYLARDRKLDRLVAVKVLRPELAETLGTDRFLREIQIAAKLSHPHILQLYDSAEVDGRLLYVMPYVEGETLRQRLEREGRLPVAAAVQLATEVLAALDYAHQHGIVHRDIKPENILLHTGQAIVADFGIARAIDAAAGDGPGGSTLTVTGVVVGTPLYMSPEQVVGDPVDGRTDVYALGCVLYEMLTGAPPFTGISAQAVLARHTVDPVPSLRKIRAEVPVAVERAIATALAKAPGDRFASAAEFRDVLTGAAPPPSGGDRRWSRRRFATAALAVAALAVAAGIWATGNRAASAAPASVAVLPFVNESNNPDDQYFAFGITDELINALGQVPGLQVTARTSAFALRDSGLDARAIGARLSRGDRPLVQHSTDNPQAYDLYLKGRYFWNQRASPPALRRAIGYFEQAIALDSSYARAWAGLADAYSLMPAFGDAPPSDAFTTAKAAAQRAVALDSTLAEAHTSLGIIAVFHDWDWATAAREFDRSLALDPTESRTHLFHAWYYRAVGRLDDALGELRSAQRLDPMSPIINARVAVILRVMRRYDEATAVAHQAIDLDSGNVNAYVELGQLLAVERKLPEALAAFPADRDLGAGYNVAGPMGYVYGVTGHRAEALAVQRRLEQRARERYITPETFAMIALGLGDTSRALDWLERGYRERSFFMTFLDEPFFDPLRGQPRFERIVHDIGLTIAPIPAR
jgi:serine/threonine-protein kinase